MKVKHVFFSVAILLSSAAFGQVGKEIKPRYGIQQGFIIKNILLDQDNNRVSQSINTINQLDSLFAVVEKSWRKYVDDSIASGLPTQFHKEAFYNIDAYSYLWTHGNLTGKFNPPENIKFHLVKKYMLPALLKDLHALKSDISIQTRKLIWMGSLANTFGYGRHYYNDKEVVEGLYDILAELGEVLNRSQQNDIETQRANHKLLEELDSYKYDIKSKYYLLNQNKSKAFDNYIIGVSTNQYPLEGINSYSKTLINYFSENGSKDKSFTILNNLMFAVSNDDLSRDSLKTWYYAVDSIRGAKFYQQAVRKTGGSLLHPSNVTLDLSQKEWQFIANGLEKGKLEKARYILLDFWYSGCKPCLVEIPALNDLHQQLRDRDDIIFVSINTDYFITKKNKEFVNGTIRKNNIRFPVIFDDSNSNISNQLNIAGYPAKFIVNNQGQVLEKINSSAMTLSTFIELMSIKN